MTNLGFSTGSIYKIADKYDPASFNSFKRKDVIEICLNDCFEVERLNNITNEVKRFSYRSIHLPSNGIIYRDDQKTNELLKKIEDFYFETKANLALVHPDLIEDFKVFEKYNLNFAIENMDDRKERYKNVEDLKEFFQHNNWKLVFDLNHCFTNDKTMVLADDIINNFEDRIVQIHLSGYFDFHNPLFKTKQDFIIDYCKKLNVPIVIESVLDDILDLEKEFDYIENVLNGI